MVMPLKIGNKQLEVGQPCYVIAEAGVNHNGCLDRAMRLIDAAVNAGADAVKFQTFRASDLVTADAPTCAYQQEAIGSEKSQLEMLRELELDETAHRQLWDYCQQQGIDFLSTPFDIGSADFLYQLGVPAFKIPSGEVTNLPLIEHIARLGKPLLLSTGMCRLADVELAVQTIEETSDVPYAILHCVSDYPADPSEVNLRALDTLRAAFSAPVGYSDHTLGLEIAWAAVARGAVVLEKHFTLDRSLPGPDHAASLEPAELTELIRGLRSIESALGDGRKRPSASELNTAQAARKSLVAKHDIIAGQTLTEEMIAIKRPGTGLPPAMLGQLVDLTAQQDIPAGTLLTREMVA